MKKKSVQIYIFSILFDIGSIYRGKATDDEL